MLSATSGWTSGAAKVVNAVPEVDGDGMTLPAPTQWGLDALG